MKRLFSLLAIGLAALAVLSACRRQPQGEMVRKLDVFGTIVEITIYGADEEAARKGLALVEADFARMHRDWHAWKPGELSRLNAALAAGRPREVSDFLLPLIRQARHYHDISDGLFNPAIGRIIAAWGFHSDELPTGPPPLDRIRALAARKPSMKDIHIDGNIVSTTNTAVGLDFGGFAKGEAVDRAMARLREAGVENAIVNAGGDLDVIGRHGKRPWVAGIRDPRNWGVVATIEMASGEALYTSGNYLRYRENEGIKYGHIIDPRTGMPVRHIASVTVLHTNGALADAAATALAVAGPKEWARIARRMGITRAMLIDGAGVVYLTPAMRRRVRFTGEGPKKVVVVDVGSGPMPVRRRIP